MNLEKITQELNNKQLEAVILKEGKNALILAGAGSGKTKVLTSRIVYLINEKNIKINEILALTFTNKAAKEMRERLSILLKRPVTSTWVGTFHSISHRLLRVHYQEAGLNSSFQIIDAQDQFRIIKRLMKENQIDEAKYPVRKIQWFINSQKDEGKKPEDIDAGYNFFITQSLKIFNLYQSHCSNNSLIDFADILLKSYELLKNNLSLREYYQKYFKHILVDEFQDTNTIQYKWIKLLFSGDNKIFCVGDDDQSIYGWRGAKIENINKLNDDFAPIETIRLEQNYRSTGNILSASNSLITNNKSRLGKSLWTDAGDGEKIDLYKAKDEKDEANFVIKTISKKLDDNVDANECAILYRSNAQSRVFEEVLIKHNIAYIIYGGLRFFDRAEIKDGLCYLRLIENSADNIAFERIVNFPTRGIGVATIEKVRDFATNNHTSFFQAAKEITPTLPTRASNSIKGFTDLIDKISDNAKELKLSEKVDYLLKESGLLTHYDNDKTDKTKSKKQNLEELVSAAKQYIHEDNLISETQGFITLASLDSAGENTKENHQCVQLMTIHSAKGLEFENVFLVGMEEDLFPSRQSKDEIHLLDEERRLCYVGMTRARKKLSLSFAKQRFLYGQTNFVYPSRFLNEIPDKYLHKIKNQFTQNSTAQKNNFLDESAVNINDNKNELSIGKMVKHQKFGFGIITNLEGSGESSRVQVRFKTAGTKWLISSYAKLEYV